MRRRRELKRKRNTRRRREILTLTLRYAEQTLVNSNRTAMLAYVALSWDPMSQNGFAWLDAAREVLDKNSDKSGATFYFTGVCSDSLDAVRYVYLLPFLFPSPSLSLFLSSITGYYHSTEFNLSLIFYYVLSIHNNGSSDVRGSISFCWIRFPKSLCSSPFYLDHHDHACFRLRVCNADLSIWYLLLTKRTKEESKKREKKNVCSLMNHKKYLNGHILRACILLVLSVGFPLWSLSLSSSALAWTMVSSFFPFFSSLFFYLSYTYSLLLF